MPNGAGSYPFGGYPTNITQLTPEQELQNRLRAIEDFLSCCKFDNCLEILNQKYVAAKCEGCDESDYSREKKNLDRYVELEKLIGLAIDCGDYENIVELHVKQGQICDNIREPHVTTPIYGCTDESSNAYNADATDPCILNGVVNGCCDESGGYTAGCTNPLALNYDPNADIDDGSCIECVYGCMTPTSVNYSANATCDDGSCVGVTYGCTDPTATNYNASATVDDGSCIFPTIVGCTDPTADNYDANATVDDGSCVIRGCTDPAAYNYNSNATSDDGSCKYGGILGCTDSTATNYNPSATIDDGKCEYEGEG